MSLDLEKLRKAATELQTRMSRGGGNGPSLKYFKPSDGKNVIRVLPAWAQEGPFAGQFWREVHQHWNVTENSPPLLCPKKTPYASDDRDCPICDFVDQMRTRKGDVEAQELVKDLRAKYACLMSVVDISDPTYTAKDVAEWTKSRPDSECPFEVGNPKVQCYAAGITIAQQIMNIVLANNLDITDRTKGHNVIVTKIPNKNKMLTQYTVTPELSKTKAPIPADFVLPDLSKVGSVKPHADLVKLLGEGPAGAFSGMLPAETTSSLHTAHNGQDDSAEDLAAAMRSQLGD